MTDRGFKIEEDVALYQAKPVIPDFTRGKKQLHPGRAYQEGSECENSRGTGNWARSQEFSNQRFRWNF